MNLFYRAFGFVLMFQMALNWCVWGQLMSSGGLRLLSTFHSGRAITCCVQNPTSCNYSVVGVLWPWPRCAIVTRPSQQWLLVNHLSRDGYCHLLVTSSFDKKKKTTHTQAVCSPQVSKAHADCYPLDRFSQATVKRGVLAKKVTQRTPRQTTHTHSELKRKSLRSWIYSLRY